METIKILNTTAVTANVNTSGYIVPVDNSAVISSVVVCNRGLSSATFRIATIPGGLGDLDVSQYLYYDVPVGANDTFVATIGITLAAENTIMVRASSSDVNFVTFGTEVS